MEILFFLFFILACLLVKVVSELPNCCCIIPQSKYYLSLEILLHVHLLVKINVEDSQRQYCCLAFCLSRAVIYLALYLLWHSLGCSTGLDYWYKEIIC